MKRSWYYIFLRVVVLLVVSVNLQAQSNDFLQNSDLKRKGFKLAIDVPNETKSMVVLKKEQLYTMFSYEQFRSYKVARNCFVASIPLLAIGTGYLAASFAIFGASLMGAHYFFMAAIPLGISVPFLVSGIVLITHSAKRISGIAENYNKQRHGSYFQNGLQVNFGLVDNGIGVKLRF